MSVTPSADPSQTPPIGIIHWAFAPVVGGVETHLAEFVQLLVIRGHRVVVFTGTCDPREVRGADFIYTEHLDLEKHCGRKARGTEGLLAREFADWLRPELVSRDIKVVHGHNLHYFSPVPALALNMLRAELQLVLHHTYHSVWSDRHDIAALCRSWPGQHAWSDYVRAFCVDQLGVAPQHTYPGITVDRFFGLPVVFKQLREQIILHPARLVEEKGAELSVRMVHRLRQQGLAVRLILTGPENIVDWKDERTFFRKEIEALIGELDLDGVVEFRAAPFAQMPYLYQEADVVVYPSRYPEPLGLVPLEAGAAGRPVVVTSTGGLPETVIDGVTGFVVPPDDLDALTHCVRDLLIDPMKARRMGIAGKDRVRDDFELGRYVDWMVEAYQTEPIH
jgi:glycosyltransferase involved in cell wall biosynthesis